jgi:hypothetical protein
MGDVNMQKLRLLGVTLVGLTSLVVPLPAFSQSCALCYTQAASAGVRMIQELSSGNLVLVIPPMLMSFFVGFVAYRKRNQFRDEETTTESDCN